MTTLAVNTEQHRYGCHLGPGVPSKRRTGYLAQDGWKQNGTRLVTWQIDRMSTSCVHATTGSAAVDPFCAGCSRMEETQ